MSLPGEKKINFNDKMSLMKNDFADVQRHVIALILQPLTYTCRNVVITINSSFVEGTALLKSAVGQLNETGTNRKYTGWEMVIT